MSGDNTRESLYQEKQRHDEEILRLLLKLFREERPDLTDESTPIELVQHEAKVLREILRVIDKRRAATGQCTASEMYAYLLRAAESAEVGYGLLGLVGETQ